MKCRKCNGTGSIAAYAFRQGGKCYSCDGTGTPVKRERFVPPTPEQAARAHSINELARIIAFVTEDPSRFDRYASMRDDATRHIAHAPADVAARARAALTKLGVTL